MDGFGYFLAAYIIVWVVVFGYIVRLVAMHRSLRREIDSLRDEMRDRSEH